MTRLKKKHHRLPHRFPKRFEELERLNLEGAKDAAKKAARSCRAAKESESSASCEDVMEVFQRGRGKENRGEEDVFFF